MSRATAATATADVVIVGGGVMGTSLAYHLAERGVRHVILLEKEELASGSTGRSAAFIRHHYSNRVTAEMAHHSRLVFENFEALTGRPSDFHKTGYLVLVSAGDEEAFRENLALHQALGIAAEEIPLEEVQRLFPQVKTEGLATAGYERDSGYADPVSVTYGFAGRARELGVEIRLGTRLIGIELKGGRVQAALTDKGRIETRVLVNAAGPWAKEVGRMAGIDLPLRLLRHQIFLFLPPFPPTCSGTDLGTLYFRPEGPDQFLIGGGQDEEVKDPDDYPQGVDQEALHEVGRRGVERFQGFEEARFYRGWSGLFTVTPDWHPILGETEVEGFYLAVGFSGHGFKLAPMIGRCLAELIVDGKAQTIDISPLRLARFAEGKLLSSKYKLNVLA
jgi:sarcosine oxidase subunit beta